MKFLVNRKNKISTNIIPSSVCVPLRLHRENDPIDTYLFAWYLYKSCDMNELSVHPIYIDHDMN